MDRRTKRQKLEAMANQSVSPQEAEIAKNKLAGMGPDQASPDQINTDNKNEYYRFWYQYMKNNPMGPLRGSGSPYEDVVINIDLSTIFGTGKMTK